MNNFNDVLIPTPFNIAAIVHACPKLFEVWKRRPFTLDMAENGEVLIRYIDFPRELIELQDWQKQLLNCKEFKALPQFRRRMYRDSVESIFPQAIMRAVRSYQGNTGRYPTHCLIPSSDWENFIDYLNTIIRQYELVPIEHLYPANPQEIEYMGMRYKAYTGSEFAAVEIFK